MGLPLPRQARPSSAHVTGIRFGSIVDHGGKEREFSKLDLQRSIIVVIECSTDYRLYVPHKSKKRRKTRE